MGLLEGKKIVVTGVLMESSLAFRVAQLAQREGAAVVLTGAGRGLSLTQRTARKLDSAVDVFEFDVTVADHVESAREQVRGSLGTVDGFVMNAISSGASAQWIGPRSDGVMSLLFTVLPPGWQSDWHENPAPQWIVPLSGRWGVETMDGQRVEMGPGEVSFGADQGTRERDGRRGHRSWTVGDQPAVLLLVQFAPEVPKPPVPPTGA